MHRSFLWSKASVKVGSVLLPLALLTSSCSASDPAASLPPEQNRWNQGEWLVKLIDRVCEVVRPFGPDFTDETIQALDESVRSQLLADIAEIEKIAPSRLEEPLATLCS